MCHITSSCAKIAQVPIKCWKVIRPDGEAHIMKGTFYSPGQTMPRIKLTFAHEPYFVYQGGRRCEVLYNVVNEGYHSFAERNIAVEYADARKSYDTNLIVQEFEIPIGSLYFKNKNGDVVSNQIKRLW